MKTLVLALLPLFLSVTAQARDIRFLRSQFPEHGTCYFTFKSSYSLHHLYLAAMRKAAMKHNPKWYPDGQIEVPLADDEEGGSYDLDLDFFYNWVTPSRDLFYEVQYELITRGADHRDFPGDLLSLAVASIYKQLGRRVSGEKIARMLLTLLKDGGTLSGVADLSNYRLQDLSSPFYYALSKSHRFEPAKAGEERNPEILYVYSISPEGQRAAREAEAQGLTADLTAAGLAKVLEIKLARLHSKKSLTELVNGLFRLYGSLAHLRLVSDITEADLRAALQATEGDLKLLLAKAEPQIRVLADYNANPGALSRRTRWSNPEGELVRETFAIVDKRLSFVRNFLHAYGSKPGGSPISHLY